jgi:hypothetical protein
MKIKINLTTNRPPTLPPTIPPLEGGDGVVVVVVVVVVDVVSNDMFDMMKLQKAPGVPLGTTWPSNWHTVAIAEKIDDKE